MRHFLALALLAALPGSEVLAETVAPTCSWVLVRATRSTAGKKRDHVTGRVLLADGGKAKAKVGIAWARRTPSSRTGVTIQDVGGWEQDVGPDGRFDVQVAEPGEQESFYVWAGADGYRTSCDVLFVPGGTELEFILIPKPEKGVP